MINIIRSFLLGLSILLVLGIATTTTTINNSQSHFDNNKNSIMAYAQQIMGIPSGGGFGGMEPQQPNQPGEYAAGTIASIQNDKDGVPTWILSGAWKGAITNIDKEEIKTDTLSSNSIKTSSDNNNLPTAMFEANFDKVMLNGASLHEHAIYNFTLSDISMTNDKNYVFNGTATISMNDVPINDVPISIKALNNNVISIWTDPAKINNHFGNTPIYGQIIQDIVIKK
ncbi:MAG TPA: hypothetical protein VHJ38_04755 [Nitrososphaeraceae archaeon]|nr:hypothetical protein [Nitrososphaeraceae archaeon]